MSAFKVFPLLSSMPSLLNRKTASTIMVTRPSLDRVKNASLHWPACSRAQKWGEQIAFCLVSYQGKWKSNLCKGTSIKLKSQISDSKGKLKSLTCIFHAVVRRHHMLNLWYLVELWCEVETK
jgi:hypothetical protein